MTGNTHRLVALGALAFYDASGQMPHTWPMLAVAAGSALCLATLPDIDLRLKIGHRTITHSLLWPALLAWLGGPVWGVVAVTLLSHILTDMLCDRVQAFWPLKWSVGIRLIKTDSMGETLFLAASVAAFTVVYILPRLPAWLPVPR